MGTLMQMTGPVMDLVYQVSALPERGQEADVTGFAMTPGGGFNAMAAARAAGHDVRLGGTLGSGPFADRVAREIYTQQIMVARPRLASLDQGCCTVLLEPDGERTFIAHPGAEGQMTGDMLAQLNLKDVTQVLLSGYSLHYAGAAQALADWIVTLPRNIMAVFDPSPVVALLNPDLLARVMDRADWISANATEAATLTGLSDPAQAARSLSTHRHGALVRMGADGCILAQNRRMDPVPPHPVTPVDTNGAGDTHIGSFLAALARHGDPLRAARYANVAAALSTLRRGPATPPDRATVEAIIET